MAGSVAFHRRPGTRPALPGPQTPTNPESTITLIAHARHELGYGTTRTQIWLLRVHQIRLAAISIRRVARDHCVSRLGGARKRWPRQLKIFECDQRVIVSSVMNLN